jgi:signal transduction histidine kinase
MHPYFKRWRHIGGCLFPGAAEKDPGFRQEIYRLGHLGLRILGYGLIGAAVFLTLARFVIAPQPETLHSRLMEAGIVIVLGAILVGLSRIDPLYPWGRALGIGGSFATWVVLLAFSFLLHHVEGHLDDFVSHQLTIVIFVSAAALPLQPLQTLGLGLADMFAYWAAATFGSELWMHFHPPDPLSLLYMLTVILLATAVSAAACRQRHGNYQAYLQTLWATDDIRKVQNRVLLSENAASLGRLAAALSHELNSPLGALASGVDTLVLLSAKQASGAPLDRERFLRLEADMRRSILDSLDRLKKIIGRMQRYTNLDRAEVQAANLSELVGDVAALIDPEIRSRAELRLELEPVPPSVCRPQQLSAVFRSLLDNALLAMDGGGCVVVSCLRRENLVEVRIRDSGRGMDRQSLKTVFDPGFKVAGEQVSTGNWSMFNARQIIAEHGGAIRVESEPGQGTTVTITLPIRETEGSLG